jgi:hypothetical protein
MAAAFYYAYLHTWTYNGYVEMPFWIGLTMPERQVTI